MTYSRGKHTIVFDDGDVKTFDLLRVRTHFGKTPPAVHEENSMSSDLKITEEEKDDISDELFQKFKVYYAKHNPDLSARNIKSLLKNIDESSALCFGAKSTKNIGERIKLDGVDETDSQDDEDDFYNDEEDTFHDFNDEEEEEEKLDDVAGEIRERKSVLLRGRQKTF